MGGPDLGSGLRPFRPGEIAEIKSAPEILATLDAEGKLDGLPFMPEMLEYCGQTVTVYKRADRTCDAILSDGQRRMQDAVFLTDLRCNGDAHGGCQAGCLIFWKEAWLRRPSDQPSIGGTSGSWRAVRIRKPSCRRSTRVRQRPHGRALHVSSDRDRQRDCSPSMVGADAVHP